MATPHRLETVAASFEQFWPDYIFDECLDIIKIAVILIVSRIGVGFYNGIHTIGISPLITNTTLMQFQTYPAQVPAASLLAGSNAVAAHIQAPFCPGLSDFLVQHLMTLGNSYAADKAEAYLSLDAWYFATQPCMGNIPSDRTNVNTRLRP